MADFDEYAYLEEQLAPSDKGSGHTSSHHSDKRPHSSRESAPTDAKKPRGSDRHAGGYQHSRGHTSHPRDAGSGHSGRRPVTDRGYPNHDRHHDKHTGSNRHQRRDRSPHRKFPAQADANKEKERDLMDMDRDIRTVFAYNISPKASERDVFEFFTKAGRISDVKMIMDRSTKRCKGFAYVEFAKQESALGALSLTGDLLLGQAIMVKSSEAEKNMAWEAQQQANASNLNSQLLSGAACKLLVTNLRLEISEADLRPLFEPFGELDLVQVDRDSSGNSRGSGLVQFKTYADATRAMQQWNGRDLAGWVVKITMAPTSDGAGLLPGLGELDEDEEAGSNGLRLNAQTRASLMNKLANSAGLQLPGTAASNTSIQNNWNSQQFSASAPSAFVLEQGMLGPASPIPTVCLLLKNMFDPEQETEEGWEQDITKDVHDECSKFGAIQHIHVDPKSKGFVYLKFSTLDGCRMAQQKLHGRFFAGKSIAAEYQFTQPYNTHFQC